MQTNTSKLETRRNQNDGDSDYVTINDHHAPFCVWLFEHGRFKTSKARLSHESRPTPHVSLSIIPDHSRYPFYSPSFERNY
jgi:hypothetical protein